MIKQILISFISIGTLYCQISNTKEIKADYDFAQFRGSESQTILEIYYAVARESLEHVPDNDGYKASYKMTLNISREDENVTSLDWMGSDWVESPDNITTGQTINDVKTLLFKPGKYSLQLLLKDLNNSTENKYERDLVIRDYYEGNYHISDIQFSHQITKAESDNRFVKNGYQITPNPTLLYNTNQPILYYYLELYNLSEFDVDSGLVLSASVIDQNNETVKTLKPVNYSNRQESAVVLNNLYVGALFTGVYDLSINLIIPEVNDTIRQNKQFYVYRPSDKLSLAEGGKAEQKKKANPFAFMAEEELDKEFEYLKYTLGDDAKDRYEELNLTGKREFLNIFWTEKENAQPGFRQELFERIEFANARYSVGKKKGWKTQPGRVLIMYGIPDDIEKQRSIATMRNYEIWSYQGLQGGALFAFVNISGYGELRLVHSTVMDEIKDYEWQQRYLR